jgi:hypothetical protein
MNILCNIHINDVAALRRRLAAEHSRQYLGALFDV